MALIVIGAMLIVGLNLSWWWMAAIILLLVIAEA